MSDRDYVLGTKEDEMERLGLQHRIWRPTVLQSWRDAGITVGSRVIDIGAGPGYATADLGGIVGPTGQVTAVERSGNFVEVARARCRASSLGNVSVHELDLMTDELPGGEHDFSWCRWVATFVADPALLARKVAGALRPGGKAIFYEYGAYSTWRFLPPKPKHERFREAVVESWYTTAGDPDIALRLPELLGAANLVVRRAVPHVFIFRPNEYLWQWPASFLDSGLARLEELGKLTPDLSAEVRKEFADAAKDPATLMMTPLVVEIVAEKV